MVFIPIASLFRLGWRANRFARRLAWRTLWINPGLFRTGRWDGRPFSRRLLLGWSYTRPLLWGLRRRRLFAKLLRLLTRLRGLPLLRKYPRRFSAGSWNLRSGRRFERRRQLSSADGLLNGHSLHRCAKRLLDRINPWTAIDDNASLSPP